MTDDVQIRVARLTDAPELVNIYAPYVKKTVISFEYEVPTVDEFRDRMANTLKKYHCGRTAATDRWLCIRRTI